MTDEASLNAVATIMKAEAGKLAAWRKTATDKLLESTRKLDSSAIYWAATIRDEHYDNDAYKDQLRRTQAIWLATGLVAAVSMLLWWVHANGVLLASNVGGEPTFKMLVGAAIFGLLGAVISSILAAPAKEGPARIPEMVATFRITLLRLLMGPAAAILIYIIIHSQFYDKIFNLPKLDANAILTISFVAGFTERLVLRVVRLIADQPS